MQRLVLSLIAALLVAGTAVPALADRDDHHPLRHHAKHQQPAAGYWSNGRWYPVAANAGYRYGWNTGTYNPHRTRYTDRDDVRHRDRDDRGRHPH